MVQHARAAFIRAARLVFTSVYPSSVVLPLAKSSSDHVPCMVNVSTVSPKATLFRFESFWVDQPGFLEVVKGSWENFSHKISSAAVLADKFKSLRFVLKKWHMSLSKLKLLIKRQILEGDYKYPSPTLERIARPEKEEP